MITPAQALKKYQEADEAANAAWNEVQGTAHPGDRQKAQRRYEALAAIRDGARKGVRFVVRCSMTSVGPYTYEGAWRQLARIESAGHCREQHTVEAVEKR